MKTFQFKDFQGVRLFDVVRRNQINVYDCGEILYATILLSSIVFTDTNCNTYVYELNDIFRSSDLKTVMYLGNGV